MRILRLIPLFLALSLSLAFLAGCTKHRGETAAPQGSEAPAVQDPDTPNQDATDLI